MSDIQTISLTLASIFAGTSIGLIILVLNRIIHGQRQSFDTFEEQRRIELRSSCRLYRQTEPLVDELSRCFSSGRQSDQLKHHLNLLRNIPPYKPTEFMAIKTIEALIIGLIIFVIIGVMGMPILALGFAAATSFSYPAISRNSIIGKAKSLLKSIKLRLPFAIDQISLMMEAGAGFDESLKTVVSDNMEHPLSEELSEVIRQMSLGRPRSQALTGFRDRISDDDISEIVFAIINGEELGTPLSNILREQANQMRLKRSQWGEKAASEAEVQMVFPGMVTMVACLLVIVAPILLPVVMTMFES
ncbi:MAG: type II secretion system F family protein [Planctomycetota bacterium]